MTKREIKIEDLTLEQLQNLFGVNDSNINLLELRYKTTIAYKNNAVYFEGDEELEKELTGVINALVNQVKKGVLIDERLLIQVCTLAKNGQLDYLNNLHSFIICKNRYNRNICPKTIGQLYYCQSLRKNDIVFGIGPAGTGKTYLAVAHAVQELKLGRCKKIILTRPAVEAGENLGFLPGDLKEKIDPYLRPLYDALDEMLGTETVNKYIEKGIIEIAPLAYMRGRTLDDAYVILDEAQNVTVLQLKMFLTRLGFKSKMIITGDITQIDLHRNVISGLKEAEKILGSIKSIDFIKLNSKDVVRHPLVQAIIEAYEKEGY
jgi:phosphate starvation-inducible PhoH-like protein